MCRKRIRILALLLAVVLLLCGCGAYLDALANKMGYYGVTNYSDMEYTRPDMAELERVLEESCDTAIHAEGFDQVIDGIYAYYDVYDQFYTNYNLADIRYCGDMTDIYWEQEYHYCAENAATVDAGLDQLYYALADSPYRQELEGEDYFGAGYFDAYEGESIWDEEFTALMEQEAQLQSQYYALSSQAMDVQYGSEEYYTVYGTQMAQIFVELVALRQQLADYAGYSSYPEFAYDFYHYRDFTPAQAEEYLVSIQQVLTPLYRQVIGSDVWNVAYETCYENETFQYVKNVAGNMGGSVEEAFSLLEEAGLYDISYAENKYNASFEVFLLSYCEPFIFMNPTMCPIDKLTFVHEFGHFANDYVCSGSVAGTDVAEVHSQAMEYLSLLYGEDTETLEQYKLADCLCTYVEQAAYALFEHQVYSLEGEALTVQNVQALYEQIGADFGFDSWAWDSRDYVTVTHLYTNPMYLISYVVSNDVAFQIYQLEKAQTGAGLETYIQCLESGESDLLSFADTYGLESPLADGRLETVRKTLEEVLS